MGVGEERSHRSRSPYKNNKSDIQERLKMMSGSKYPSSNKNKNNSEKEPLKIEREKTCPLLLRVFCQLGRHHRPDEFSYNKTPSNELQIYTWKDATLKELMNLVKEVNPEARHKGTYFDFGIMYPDFQRGGYLMKDIGTTCAGQKCPDDNVSLHDIRFHIGDYLDIAIMLPPKERRENMV